MNDQQDSGYQGNGWDNHQGAPQGMELSTFPPQDYPPQQYPDYLRGSSPPGQQPPQQLQQQQQQGGGGGGEGGGGGYDEDVGPQITADIDRYCVHTHTHTHTHTHKTNVLFNTKISTIGLL